MLKVAAATALFAVVHSAFASTTAKRAAETAFGRRHRNGLYRPFFIVQSAATFGVLAAYIARRPSRTLYQVRGPLATAMHVGQVVGLVCTIPAARQVGFGRITGLENLVAWAGNGPVSAEPEAQGPALDAVGLSRPAGPFAWSRHPLNFFPLVVLWLWPRMTSNLFAFNAVATAYLVIGSWHEEVRLRHAYGERYDTYRNSGVPFYVPRPTAPVRLTGPAPGKSEANRT